MKTKSIFLPALGLTTVLGIGAASAVSFRVTITNNAPANGVAITPVWGGFHDGSFDSYNGGLSSQEGLERLAEDGNTGVISSDFLGGYTYIDTSTGTAVSNRVLTSQTSGRVDFTLGAAMGPPPLQPGETASTIVNGLSLADNQFFSYASMILPSNDYYIANGAPMAHDLASLFTNGGQLSFNIGNAGTINDAGTEVNDFLTAAPGGPNLPGLFPGRGLPNGQSGPNTGADQNGVNVNVSNPFGDFLNQSGVDLAGFDFNDTSLYPNGIATVTIEAIPEPSTALLLGLGALGLVRRRR